MALYTVKPLNLQLHRTENLRYLSTCTCLPVFVLKEIKNGFPIADISMVFEILVSVLKIPKFNRNKNQWSS